VIHAKDISFHYAEGKQVLQNISFEFEKGKTLAIVGASGCGKSTLLRIISGILPCTNSNQLLGALLLENQTPDQYRQTGKLAFMFQEATLMPHLTVKENIELPLKINGSIDPKKVADLIKAVGLEEFATYLPKQLSGGMKTRVALARAFATEPELLLLDEPFSALDIGWKSDLYKRLVSLYHTTIVIVTHDVQEAILLADDIIVLNRKGSIQAKFSVKTDISIENRVNDIASFVNDKAFKELFPALQQAIILDEERKTQNKTQIDEILDIISKSVGDISKENTIQEKQIDSIRDFADSEYVNNRLVDAFKNSNTARLKYMLLWDILEYTNLSNEAHQQYFEYYLDNIALFSKMSRQWYKTQTDEAFFQTLKGRIETAKGYNQKKKWIYICDLFAVNQLPDLLPFLEAIETGLVKEVNFPLAKMAAQQIKTKIKNAKQDSIHIA
jgi:ABC-type nitrate/sulfonate/bicarbonate transport system ATPase subunit